MLKFKHSMGNESMRGAFDFCVRWIGIVHSRIAFGFLYVFRKLAGLLGHIPWSCRAGLAALVASAILLVCCLYGNTVLLMAGFSRIDSTTESVENEETESTETSSESANPADEFAEKKLTVDAPENDEHFSLGQIGALKRADLASINPERLPMKGDVIDKLYRDRFEETGFNDENLFLSPVQIDALYRADAFRSLNHYRTMGWWLLALLVTGAILGFLGYFVKIIRVISWYVLVTGGLLFAVYWICLIVPMFGLPDALLSQNRKDFDAVMRDMMWFAYLWYWMPVVAFSFFLWFPLFLSRVKDAFGVRRKKVEFGDIWEKDLTCRGNNPGLYRGGYWAFTYHFVVLLLIPLILKGCYQNDEYAIPDGGGGTPVQVAVAQMKPKPKPVKKYVLNPNSAILFDVPPIDDTVSEQLDEDTTKDVYQTTTLTIGQGKKGTRGGWASGMKDGKIRFIRLEYRGGDWDQDMGKGADFNMLLWLQEKGGFKIADNTESMEISRLSRWKRGKAPPFVYITGSGGISISPTEAKQIRKYLLETGGMLFADNGGGSFDYSFRNMLRQILPELELIDIANDDPIYQSPFIFPNGAPRLFHHSGNRALGLKYNGRWVVFYHQGDINDAWKAGGSGVSPETQTRAFQMGANVISYAFTQYLAMISRSKIQ